MTATEDSATGPVVIWSDPAEANDGNPEVKRLQGVFMYFVIGNVFMTSIITIGARVTLGRGSC